jgi:poly(A) polymerase
LNHYSGKNDQSEKAGKNNEKLLGGKFFFHNFLYIREYTIRQRSLALTFEKGDIILVLVQPKIYPFEEHQIPVEKIDSDARFVIHRLKEAGHTAYLVGGGVRDLLLNTRPKDFDVSTSATPEEVRALFRNSLLIGRRFRLVHVRFGKKVIEVSTFRSGDQESESLIVRDNEWGSEVEDVLRRDFTINGLFYDPETQRIIDYVGGFGDVEKRILRVIGTPSARFVQDPVRMIRLLKFCARVGFEIDGPTYEALLKCKDHIIMSSPARILEELLRMLESGSSESFFRLLHQYGLLKLLIAPLSHFIDLDPEGRIFKMLQELDSEIKKIWPEAFDRAVPLAALCFPVFELTIHHLAAKAEKPLHLGLIAREAYELVENLFMPFFRIPRRLHGVMVFALASQFRFTPLDKRTLHRPRVPRDESFPLALHLFKLRCALDHQLFPIYTLWTEASFAQAEKGEASAPPPPRRRRRPRRRAPSHE